MQRMGIRWSFSLHLSVSAREIFYTERPDMNKKPTFIPVIIYFHFSPKLLLYRHR